MKPREERIEHIRKAVNAAEKDENQKNYYTVKNWRGKPLYRKILRLDSEYLMFRIENSRTEIQQLAYVRKHGLPESFFNDPESVAAQTAQEDILREMIRAKGKDLIVDLKVRKQDDACIVTYDGYLVNGNRRTAALRELKERYIDCIVLPEDAEPKDIYNLEQQLQITQDFREEYHWINELRNIKKGLDDKRLGLTLEEIAANLRIDLKDIRILLRMLDLVDAFLIWRKIPGQYDYPKLDRAEEVFRQLEKAIKKYVKDDHKREALQNAVFNLIEQRPAESRLYGYVGDLIRNFDQIHAKIENNDTSSSAGANPPKQETKGTVLDSLLEGETVVTTTIFDDPDKAIENASTIIEIIEDIKAENKEKRDTEAVYESVSAALRELQGLTIDSDTAKIGSIKNKLEQIISVSQRLIEELKPFGR